MTPPTRIARGDSRAQSIAGKFTRVALWGLLAAVALCAACSRIDTAKAPEDILDQVQEKIDGVVANAAQSPVPSKSTIFSESEINTALRVNLKEKLPKGIGEPQVRLLGNSRIAARAIVDVDEFKRKRTKPSGGGPLNFFGGKIPILVRGELIARDGQGVFKLESAEANGIPLPRSLVLDLLATHTRSRNNPAGFNLEKPFELPAGIREVTVNADEVIFVQ
jgi:hypothetical protein